MGSGQKGCLMTETEVNMENKKKIDTEAIAYHIREILKALGDDPEREGLKDTPKRVAKMYEEVFEGMNYTNKEIADMFNKTFALNECDEYDGIEKMQNMVVVRDIDIFSYCEHHLALMYDMKVTGAEDIAVFIEGCHSCMTARGIKKVNAKTYTQTLKGRFNNESNGFIQWWNR